MTFMARAAAEVWVHGPLKPLAEQDHDCRLNADGSLDPSFNPDVGGPVYALALQSDGGILVGGRDYIRRLNNTEAAIQHLRYDGSTITWLRGGTSPEVWRTSFDYSTNGTDWINLGAGDRITDGWQQTGLSLPLDAIIRARGYTVGGRYNASSWFVETTVGPPGISFQPASCTNDFDTTASFGVYAGGSPPLSYQRWKDGTPLVGATSETLTLSNLQRTNAGSYWVVVSNTFGAVSSSVAMLSVNLARPDTSFNPGASGNVYCLALQPDGKILVGGRFERLAGRSCGSIGRLHNTEPAIQHLSCDGSTLTWLREGTSPEVWRTSVDLSTNAVTWTSVGAGTRIPGGWQLDGVTLPLGGTICARGHVTGGHYNGSSWFVEAYIGAPVLVTQPCSRTNAAGTTATFSILAGGTEPLSYRWHKDGAALADGGIFAGTTTHTLSVSQLRYADQGGYSVVVSNAHGVVTSQIAQLTVLTPPILEPLPASTTVTVNSNVTFVIDATGTPPLRYQWRKNGVNIPGATNAWLTITNVQFTDGGSYSVVVANSVGAVTSDPTLLVVEVASQAPPEDDFVNRRTLAGTNGFAAGTNLFATREVGEPDHGGKRGSNSVWYTWRAPTTGIATFRTVGSTFDTLLGVYTNDLSVDPLPSIVNLVLVADDEDRGGYLTSQLRFNAVEGNDYQVAIDGFAGGQGTFILSWELEPTAETLPVITAPPEGQVVFAGRTVTFSITATGGWASGGARVAGGGGVVVGGAARLWAEPGDVWRLAGV